MEKLSHKCGSEDIVAPSYVLPAGEVQQSMDLTDEQWEVLELLIPDPPRREDRRGRPWRDPRDVLNGILWILRTGAPWRDLPERYPPYQTCHRRLQRWIEEGVLDSVLQALAEDLEERGEIDLSVRSLSFTSGVSRPMISNSCGRRAPRSIKRRATPTAAPSLG